METELLLSFNGFPSFSIKGCTQTLFFPSAKTTRTLQGDLIHIGPPYKKYQSVIEGWETNLISNETFSPGNSVEVGCLQRLWQKVEKGSFVLGKNYVRPSLHFVGKTHKENLKTCFAPEDGYISYRPFLKMMVVAYYLFAEKEKKKWKLELEEI